MFWGLQQVKGKLFHIDAEKDAVPFHISITHAVPIPLLGPLKKQLDQIPEIGKIKKSKEPTKWCRHPIVEEIKPNSKIRLRIDLTKLKPKR